MKPIHTTSVICPLNPVKKQHIPNRFQNGLFYVSQTSHLAIATTFYDSVYATMELEISNSNKIDLGKYNHVLIIKIKDQNTQIKHTKLSLITRKFL